MQNAPDSGRGRFGTSRRPIDGLTTFPIQTETACLPLLLLFDISKSKDNWHPASLFGQAVLWEVLRNGAISITYCDE